MLKRVLQGAVAMAVLASVALLQASPAAAGTQGPYGIDNWFFPGCVAIGSASTAEDAAAIMWSCHSPSTDEQKWYFVDTDSGYYLIKNKRSGKCLTVYQNTTTNNGTVVQHGCNTSDNEEWYPSPRCWQCTYFGGSPLLVADFYWLINRHSGKCLSTKNFASVGSALVQFDCGAHTSQRWTWGPFYR